MYNLVKSTNNQPDNLSKRVIDANEKFKEIRQRREEEARFKPGLPIENSEEEKINFEESGFDEGALFEDRGDASYDDSTPEGCMDDETVAPEEAMDEPESEGFTPGLAAEHIDDALPEDNDIYGEEPDDTPILSDEEILASVQERAMQFIEEARERAKQDSDELYEKAYENAIINARAVAQEEHDQMMAEIEARRASLNEEFEAKVDELNEQFIPTLLSVFEEVLSVEIEDYRPIIFELIKKTLLNIDSPRQLTIKVSAANYDTVNDALPEIESIIGRTSLIEVLREESFDDTMCTIETERGIFDCGFDTELKNLKKRIFLLSKS
ncbi:MAG: hypothetical protein II147_02015 [Lachnospiraceae bacterium]|nr:hypothetical protein [Lachnospiraceae bacterium]